VYRVVVGSAQGRLHDTSRREWQDNITMDLQEVEWGLDRIEVAKVRDR